MLANPIVVLLTLFNTSTLFSLNVRVLYHSTQIGIPLDPLSQDDHGELADWVENSLRAKLGREELMRVLGSADVDRNGRIFYNE